MLHQHHRKPRPHHEHDHAATRKAYLFSVESDPQSAALQRRREFPGLLCTDAQEVPGNRPGTTRRAQA